MPARIRKRVTVSDHALARYRERVGWAGKREIANLVARHLYPALHLGLEPDEDGAVRVLIAGGHVAVCYASAMGGWELATVLEPENELEVAG